MPKASKKKNLDTFLPWIIAIIAIIVAFYFYSGQQVQTLSKEERLGMLWSEFHVPGSEFNITKYFPDATIIYSYKNPHPTNTSVLLFKYYYSPEIDKTIIACDRNSTLAICNGRYTDQMSTKSVLSCVVAGSLIYRLYNSTF